MKEIIKLHTAQILNDWSSKEGKDAVFIPSEVLVNTTRPEFKGDYTVVIFPFVKKLGVSPGQLSEVIGQGLVEQTNGLVESFEAVKGFLNLTLSKKYWINSLQYEFENTNYGIKESGKSGKTVLIEYLSPNTNKPLHLGHIRNIFLGTSISRIMEANGDKVIPVCLYNDRGTNISKSMVAWMKYGNGATPESTKTKGDHFVGEYYVKFAQLYKEEIASLKQSGLTDEQAKKASQLEQEVNNLLLKWESGDAEVRRLWQTMNNWVYKGFEETYKKLGVSFVKSYYESDVYNLGKKTVAEGLEKGIFYKKEDGAIAIDLSDVGLDEKIVLRANGTTIYITQDIEIAYQKQQDFEFDQSIYVVGNEQDYHFKVLFEILKRLGMKAAENLYHLSYGMVELPSGKMKSREGTVVDADDLIEEMELTARQTAEELGKIGHFSEAEKQDLYSKIGLGALRYFILKVDPKKKMLFNPQESIDFNGNTGPFIQYTHARICSILRNFGQEVSAQLLENNDYTPSEKEISLLRNIAEFPDKIEEAANAMSPAIIANYVYELAKEYNQFYQDFQVLKEEYVSAKNFRLVLSKSISQVIKNALNLLCIEAPERM